MKFEKKTTKQIEINLWAGEKNANQKWKVFFVVFFSYDDA